MKTVKIYFVDFWDGFDPNNNFFTRLLTVKYDFTVYDKDIYDGIKSTNESYIVQD